MSDHEDQPFGPLVRQAWQKTTAVVVTHNSAMVVSQCLASVARAARIIVVDNESEDKTRELVTNEFPAVELIYNAVGLGFGNACNQGLARVGTEFVLMINPDATLEETALERLAAAARRYPEAAVFAPAIRNPDGSLEISFGPSLLSRARRRFGRLIDDFPEGDLCPEYVSGAVVFARMQALREVGFFDPSIFLYYEDDDLWIRMRSAGHPLVLVPDAVARHLGGASSPPSHFHQWEKFWNLAWSRLYMEQKYFGRWAAWRLALPRAARFLAKAVAYGVVFHGVKGRRDLARLAGTLSFIMGRRASKTPH